LIHQNLFEELGTSEVFDLGKTFAASWTNVGDVRPPKNALEVKGVVA